LIHNQGKDASFVFAILAAFLIDRMVIKRITRLGEDLSFIGSTGNLAARVKVDGKDELANLALSINSTLGNLENAVREMRASEGKFRSIIESSHDLVILMNTDGTIAYLSPACKHVIGWDPKLLVGKRPSIFHPEDDARVQAALGKALEGKGGAGLEYRMITQSGEERWVSHSWAPLLEDGKLKMVASVVQDITERKAVHDELIRQKEQIEDLSKTKDQFMADMTHELKTPLSVIILNLEMARKLAYSKKPEVLKSCFDLMWRNALRLSRSIEQIMQLTNVESADFSVSRFSIADIIGDVCEEYIPLAKTKGVRFEISGPDIRIESNKRLLSMAVSNLVSNAIKFTQHGSVKIRWESRGENVVISVSDTGIGIQPKNSSKVFNKFFKEDHDSPGSGVGLAISSDLIIKMGGSIEFDSEPRKGSTFRIIVPKKLRRRQ